MSICIVTFSYPAGYAHWEIHSHSYGALRVIVMLARCINMYIYICVCVCVCVYFTYVNIYSYIFLPSGIRALGDPLTLVRSTTRHRYAGQVHKHVYTYICVCVCTSHMSIFIVTSSYPAGYAHWAIQSHSYGALRVIVMLARCINMYIHICVCVCVSMYSDIYIRGLYALGDPLTLLRSSARHRYAGQVHKQYIYI